MMHFSWFPSCPGGCGLGVFTPSPVAFISHCPSSCLEGRLVCLKFSLSIYIYIYSPHCVSHISTNFPAPICNFNIKNFNNYHIFIYCIFQYTSNHHSHFAYAHEIPPQVQKYVSLTGVMIRQEKTAQDDVVKLLKPTPKPTPKHKAGGATWIKRFVEVCQENVYICIKPSV